MGRKRAPKSRGAFSSRSPPVWKSEPILTKTTRLHATSALSAVAISPENTISWTVGLIAVTSTTSAHLARSMRLKKIKVYFNATAVGTYTEAIVDWASDGNLDIYSPNSSVEKATMSSADMCVLVARPPPGSYASMWLQSDVNTAMYTLTVPSGSIIDITVEYVVNDSDAVLAGPAIVGATVGTIYHYSSSNMVVSGALNSTT